MYFVLQSQYEFRQFGRLFSDVFKLKGCTWPITKADAAYQKSYLSKLRKYSVLAVPESPVSPEAQEYYLKVPDIASRAGRDELALQVEHTGNQGDFRFDEENGWLFHCEVDEYDYMYHLHAESPSVPPGVTELPLSWKRSRMVMEEAPYRFKGALKSKQDSSKQDDSKQDGIKKFLCWRYYNRGGGGFRKARWDTKKITDASTFVIDPRVEELKISVSIDPPTAAPATPGPDLRYKLKLIPVPEAT